MDERVEYMDTEPFGAWPRGCQDSVRPRGVTCSKSTDGPSGSCCGAAPGREKLCGLGGGGKLEALVEVENLAGGEM